MRKLVTFLLCLCSLLSSCKKEDKSIKYDGPTTVNIVLQEIHKLNASSTEQITYSSDNRLIVDIDQNGRILGKNIGETYITLSNSEDELRLHVVVSLFEEPTLDFGVSTSKIRALYGNPKHNYGDSIYVYGSGNDWYSWAVWEMDFFFRNDKYYESNLYIRSDVDLRVEQYLNENYFFTQEINDTIDNKIKTLYIYLNAEKPENATVIVAKQYDAGPENDILLVYAPFSSKNRDSDYTDIIKRNLRRN